MRVAICDDENMQLSMTKTSLETAYKSLDLVVDTYNSGVGLLNAVDNVYYDLIILDIEMPGLNGIDTAKKLRKIEDKTAIVFLTSHVEYALEGYEVNALRYLTKPANTEKLSEIITYLLEQKKKDKRILLRNSEDVELICVADIYYMEAQNQMMRVVTDKGEYWNRYNLGDYEAELSAYGFFRIHRGYLINLGHVLRLSGREIVMDDNASLPVSRTKEAALKNALFHYVRNEAI
ncbi:MAG: response regulator transcription factor [Lachnospiraceae bacterium]|nr:response regulator transcription factor [Lachnospiraceae bacterium]